MLDSHPEPIRRAAEALAKQAKIDGTDGWINCVPTVGLLLAALGAPTEDMVGAGCRALNGSLPAKQLAGSGAIEREAVNTVWAAMVDRLVGHARVLVDLEFNETVAGCHDYV